MNYKKILDTNTQRANNMYFQSNLSVPDSLFIRILMLFTTLGCILEGYNTYQGIRQSTSTLEPNNSNENTFLLVRSLQGIISHIPEQF